MNPFQTLRNLVFGEKENLIRTAVQIPLDFLSPDDPVMIDIDTIGKNRFVHFNDVYTTDLMTLAGFLKKCVSSGHIVAHRRGGLEIRDRDWEKTLEANKIHQKKVDQIHILSFEPDARHPVFKPVIFQKDNHITSGIYNMDRFEFQSRATPKTINTFQKILKTEMRYPVCLDRDTIMDKKVHIPWWTCINPLGFKSLSSEKKKIMDWIGDACRGGIFLHQETSNKILIPQSTSRYGYIHFGKSDSFFSNDAESCVLDVMNRFLERQDFGLYPIDLFFPGIKTFEKIDIDKRPMSSHEILCCIEKWHHMERIANKPIKNSCL